MRAHLNESPFARRQSGGGEVERAGVAAASGAHQHAGTRERRARGQRKGHVAGLGRIAFHDFFLPVKAHAMGSHGVGQATRDLRIEKRHQRVTAIHQMHLGPQRREGAGVFAANHAAADHDELLGQRLEFENLVRVMHAVVVEGKFWRPQGRRTRGDENFLAANQSFRTGFVDDPDRMRVRKARHAVELTHAAQRQPRLDPLPFTAGDAFLVPHEISHRGLAANRKVHAMKLARAPTREHERGLAQRLTGDGAGVDARAADHRGLLHEGNFFPEQARRQRAAGTGGTAAEDDEIKLHKVGLCFHCCVGFA